MLATCRHLIILGAIDLDVGESYRHAHFMHRLLFQKGYTIFSYDIVCLYWKWAVKVGSKIPEYRDLTEKMTPFLARFHALAHVWYCYMLWAGHWKSGVGALTGEEPEQVNAFMSPYGPVTMHMGSGSNTVFKLCPTCECLFNAKLFNRSQRHIAACDDVQ